MRNLLCSCPVRFASYLTGRRCRWHGRLTKTKYDTTMTNSQVVDFQDWQYAHDRGLTTMSFAEWHEITRLVKEG